MPCALTFLPLSEPSNSILEQAMCCQVSFAAQNISLSDWSETLKSKQCSDEEKIDNIYSRYITYNTKLRCNPALRNALQQHLLFCMTIYASSTNRTSTLNNDLLCYFYSHREILCFITYLSLFLCVFFQYL